MATNGEASPYFIVTDDDRRGIEIITCTLLASWMILVFLIRLELRWRKDMFGLDDWACTAATIVGCIQTIVSCFSISHGFGMSLKLLDNTAVDFVEKTQYASTLLYILANGLGKCSTAMFFARINTQGRFVKGCYGTMALSMCWTIISVIAEAFGCRTFREWTTFEGACPGALARWKAITAFDLITEIALFTLSVWLVWKLQMQLKDKIIIVAACGFRIPLIPIAIVRLHYIGVAFGSTDWSLAGATALLCTQLEMHYGIMATTIPTLRPFFRSFNTNWGNVNTRAESAYALDCMSKFNTANGSKASTNRDRQSGVPGRMAADFETRVQSMHIARPRGRRRDSTASDSSQKIIIRQDRSYEVQFEDLPSSGAAVA